VSASFDGSAHGSIDHVDATQAGGGGIPRVTVGQSITVVSPSPPDASDISAVAGADRYRSGQRIDSRETVATLSGTNLCSPSQVSFGSVPDTAVTVNAGYTTLTIVDPPGSGTVAVVVTTATGFVAAPTEFSYIAPGYWTVTSNGSVSSFAGPKFYGSLPRIRVVPNAAIVSMAATPDGQGYWIFGATGSVDTYGDATNDGSMLGQIPASVPIAAGAATTNGHGYWLFGQNGGVYAFGSAPFDGSLQSLDTTPSGPIVGGVGF